MMLPLVQALRELKWMEQEGLPLAGEVLGNGDGAIPDSIVQERSSLDNGGDYYQKVLFFRPNHNGSKHL